MEYSQVVRGMGKYDLDQNLKAVKNLRIIGGMLETLLFISDRFD